jgi:hypothetical protein
MIGMSNGPRKLFQSMHNTLSILTERGLTIFHNNPVYKERNGEITISWPYHIPGRINCSPHFGRIPQYRSFIETGAFTCLLIDGAIIRAAYKFKGRDLVSHTLLWWPSPFAIAPEDLELGGVVEIFDLYSGSNDWHEQIQMRTPVRFDYDSVNASSSHPASHVHMQTSECRLYVDRPVCFNRFIKFIFLNFYPKLYHQHSFWGDLEETIFNSKSMHNMQSNQAYFGWNDTVCSR